MQNFIIVWAVIPGTLLKMILYLGIPLTIILLYLLVRGTHAARMNFLKFRQRSIDDLVINSNHPPVLYLRPFAIDGTGKRSHKIDLSKFKLKINLGKLDLEFSELNFEVELAKKCEKIAPFIAIGNSRGVYSENFGAARVYYPDDEWQSKAIEKMNKSCMIIMRASEISKGGVSWEIENLTVNYLRKTVFLLERSGSLQTELIKRLQLDYPDIASISNASFPCFVEFLDNNQISIHKDISQTFIYRQLYKLSKLNKHYMYCANCGEANKTENTFCVKCGVNLGEQVVNRHNKPFNPFMTLLSGDNGFFLLAIFALVRSAAWFWFQQKTGGNFNNDKPLWNMLEISSFVLGIIFWLILIFFTVKVWRQLIILVIALLLLGYDAYNIYNLFYAK